MFCRSLAALFLTCLSSILLVAGATLYGRFIEPHWIEETQWELPAANWKGRPLRLAIIADLHARPHEGAYLDSIVRRILDARPDAVLMLGDYTHEPWCGECMNLDELGQHLSPLAQLPCFAVLGSHDYAKDEKAVIAMLQGFGTKLLDGRTLPFEAGGDTLYLMGMRCQCRFSTPGDMEPAPEGSTCLLLTHSPAGAHFAPRGVTAILCAHTHGGQVCLPGGIPILKPDKRVEWREMKGAFLTKGKPVYVTRGLGMSRMPVRLFCRPELLFVDIKNEE